MYEKLNFTIEGVTPTIMHNGQGASFLNPITKEIKKVSSKRNKTEEDHILMAQLEWLSSLYTTEGFEFDVNNYIVIRGGGIPCWPGINIEAAIVEAGKSKKLGKELKRSMMCDGDWPILYDGPTTINELFNDRRFWDQRLVVVQRNRILRTRPIFKQWKLNFEIMYMPSRIDKDVLIDIVRESGISVGLSDYRPKYGRFNVVNVE